jgi:hypothetical protein
MIADRTYRAVSFLATRVKSPLNKKRDRGETL